MPHRRDFADVARLIADALHVGNHFQRRADGAQVTRDGLLLEQHVDAHRFHLALLFVHNVVTVANCRRFRHVVCLQRANCPLNRVLHQCAHRHHLLAKLRNLVIKMLSHRKTFFL